MPCYRKHNAANVLIPAAVHTLEAIASGEADINQCPPGGESTIQALATLLDREVKPLNPENGEVKQEATVAYIHEDTCIGCTLCIQACPVDSILGAAKQMHTIIADECTGCELCVEPCRSGLHRDDSSQTRH